MRFSLFLLCLLLPFTLKAQTITQAEYFLDTDPGRGGGTAINITEANAIDVNFNIPLTTVNKGFHILYVRVKDSGNNWSITQNTPFYNDKIEAISNLTQIEYFLDTDPGAGLGNPISFTPGTTTAINYTVPLSAVSAGFHVLYIRTRDENGRWSITQNTSFYNDTFIALPNLTQMEYFLDSDPGPGLGNPISFTPGAAAAVNYTVPLSAVSSGFHILYIRTRDANGHWSTTQNALFYKDHVAATFPNLNSMEYFLDTDPGLGLGSPISITPGTTAAVQYTVPLNSVSKGFHVLYVRTRDENGQWSITQNTPFYNDHVEAVPDIKSAEYFIDADPGPGKGTAIAITSSNAIDQNFMVPLNGLSSGPHILYVRVQDSNNHRSITHNKSINNGCGTTAYFSATENPTSTLVAFKDTSSGANMKWYWDFGNGQFSTDQNPSHSFAKGGVYQVCLTVRDSVSGCQDRVCAPVKAGNTISCKTKFNFFTDGVSTKIQFDGKSFNSDSSIYYWSFGDGEHSTAANPAYSYAVAGYYDVCLYTKDTVTGCQSHYCYTVQAGSSDCLSKFTAMPDDNSTTVNFSNQSLGDSTKWYWDFGNGIMSNVQHPRYTYPKGGYYTVCLTISKDGCMDSYCEDVHVGTDNCKTAFSFFSDPLKKEVEFKDLSQGNPTEWFWEPGDGTGSVLQNPKHVYANEGIYTVCLTTKNASGCMNHYCENITVGSVGEDCQAVFETFEENGVASFKNKSIGNADTYFWDFGDQNYSTTFNADHTYIRDGYYTVSLTIYNQASGCFNTGYTTVVVGATAPDIACRAKYNYIADKNTNVVEFKDVSVGNPVSWEWNFSDGSSSNEQNPTHTFSGPGFYQVCLTITSSNGSSNVYCSVVGIDQTGLGASFIFEEEGMYYLKNAALYPVSFYGSAYGKPSKWKWAFGDNTYDSLRINLVHNYTEPGSYNACLTLSDAVAKLSSNYCKVVKVGSYTGNKENLAAALNINVFPNPITNKATVSYSLEQPARVQLSLFDLQGRKIKSLVNENQRGRVQTTIDISDLELADGLYLINLAIDGQSFNKPVIIKK